MIVFDKAYNHYAQFAKWMAAEYLFCMQIEGQRGLPDRGGAF